MTTMMMTNMSITITTMITKSMNMSITMIMTTKNMNTITMSMSIITTTITQMRSSTALDSRRRDLSRKIRS